MAEQLYQPYRTQLISRDDLKRLSRLRPRRVALDIAFLWSQIVAAWSIAALIDMAMVYVIAAVLVGNRYYSLFIIAHDGLHRRLHLKQSVNDAINDWLILGAIGAITRLNRHNHIRHHSSLGLNTDPDRYKFQSRRDLPVIGFLFSLTGLPFAWRAVRNVFAPTVVESTQTLERYYLRDVAVIALWQTALLGGLTLAFGWWGYIAMWWLPVYVFAFCADMARVFCEHSSESDSLASRLVTFQAGSLELAVFAPMNMNHHTAHHLWPAIPYYNLPEASGLLQRNLSLLPGSCDHPVVRVSYFKYLLSHLRPAYASGN